MNIQEANAYVNAAPDATERERRKAETFHIRYGSPTRLIVSGGRAGGKSMALNYMIQSQHAQKVMVELQKDAEARGMKTVDGETYVMDMETATGRFDKASYDVDWWEREGGPLFRRITRHRETRRKRRIRAQELRRERRMKLAGCNWGY